MTAPRDTQRLRQGLNPLLTTSLGGFHNQPLNTPLSAVSLVSAAHFHSAQPTPTNSAIQPYNPQEWIGSPVAGPERTHQFPDAQISPPPPPPYSPPWNQNQPQAQTQTQRPGSGNFDVAPAANTSAPRVPPTNIHRPSPEPPVANTSFPPPPNSNGRGNSRERRFGLPSLRRHKDHQEQQSPPEPVPPISISRPAPLQIQIPLGQPVPQRDIAQPTPQRTTSGSSQGPPGARRAVSASAIETPTSARSRSTSQTRWEPGMPLPPPPPGPPPSASRSQSAQSESRTSDPIVSGPTRRPPPSNGSTLGPVPPTPADWVDNPESSQGPSRGRSPGLTIDTTRTEPLEQVSDPDVANGLGSAGLSRAKAVRHDKTIVQRRTESRTRHGDSADGGPQPVQLTDIVVPDATTLSRRRTINRSTPRSAGRGYAEDGHTREGESHLDSRNATPKAPGSARKRNTEASTPPFSPYPPGVAAKSAGHPSTGVVPKALPTPPSQSRSTSSSQPRASMSSADLTPSVSTPAAKHLAISQSAEDFCRGTTERFQAFAAKEAAASSDGDRVRLFADFIVSESRIRRERYAPAIGAMGSEIFDLTRDLFRPMAARRESGVFQGPSAYTPQSSEPSRSHRGSMNSTYRDGGPSSAGGGGQSSSAPSSANVPASPGGTPSGNGNWASNYMPSLSPILSLSVSGNGDGSSRGRPSSRWWEAESTGFGGQILERSKRESKYMGMPREAREALQWADSPFHDDAVAGPSDQGWSSEYPPEKTGWHDQDQALTPQPLRHSTHSLTSSGSPTTPNPAHLDISRLITLPPPYPRHYPAVNNNHPELASTRNAVRQISDFTELECTKERFAQTSRKKREEAAKAATERRTALRNNLQREINSGNMSFAEASAIEQDSNKSEKETLKELEKAEFDHFQSQVVMPLNELLTSRIGKADALFNQLASRLFNDVDNPADMPQEEGDDKPELLEKLTLLKWIFEARETLHRTIYDLLSERNDRYRDVVLTPYRLAENEEKLRSAQAFFAQDAEKRQLAFAREVLARTRAFRDVMEQNVMRGVEVQLSAFWDIAPLVRQLLDTIPQDMSRGDFRVQIPAHEYQENPAYHQHPLQYLFSLVLHAEKSTYQFIESQTNLLCLLHEVKEAMSHARAHVVQSDIEDEGLASLSPSERAGKAKVLRKEEETRLTGDLQEKVRVVQDQWHSALGEGIRSVKQVVGEWLLQTGGWDESLEEGGVGSV